MGNASLRIESGEKGGFDLSLGITYYVSEREILIHDKTIKDSTLRERRTLNLKTLRNHSPDKASLDVNVQRLLTSGKEYAGSPQYDADLRGALEPIVEPYEEKFIIKTFCQKARY